MTTSLYQEIQALPYKELCDQQTKEVFLNRLAQGDLTRDENPASHFCTFFVPYNPQTKQVFVTHHKKAGQWLCPGGHINKGETVKQTMYREIKEELGVITQSEQIQAPFYLSMSDITRTSTCSFHYDLWYLLLTDGTAFNIDYQEFHQVKWMSIQAAQKIVIHDKSLKAFTIVQQLYG